jgi:hypothetical protein
MDCSCCCSTDISLDAGEYWSPGAFLFFAACSVCTIILTIKTIPETKNKSLEEIEAFWKKG